MVRINVSGFYQHIHINLTGVTTWPALVEQEKRRFAKQNMLEAILSDDAQQVPVPGKRIGDH